MCVKLARYWTQSNKIYSFSSPKVYSNKAEKSSFIYFPSSFPFFLHIIIFILIFKSCYLYPNIFITVEDEKFFQLWADNLLWSVVQTHGLRTELHYCSGKTMIFPQFWGTPGHFCAGEQMQWKDKILKKSKDENTVRRRNKEE